MTQSKRADGGPAVGKLASEVAAHERRPGRQGGALSVAEELANWLAAQEGKELLRFITCGSVDDGKSTIIGRLLWETGNVYADQLEALERDSRRFGTQGEALDFALLVDGLMAEREQGITIDVAYRYFATAHRKFIVADSPGHEQYTRNMVTAASTAQAAVLLVDANKGLLTQTRRHAYLMALMGVKQVILAINKMDLVGYAQRRYEEIVESFRPLANHLGFAGVTAIPLAAVHGDNLTCRSPQMPWYDGPTLLGALETVPIAPTKTARAIFPVQWVSRPDAAFRGYAGTVAGGCFQVGDAVRVTSSGQTAQIAEIVTADGRKERAAAGEAVTLVLDREIDLSRGDLLTRADEPLEMTDQFEATLVWLHQEAGFAGRSYELKLAHQWSGATLTGIKYRIDINTQAHEAAKTLSLNDIAVVSLALARPIAFTPYEENRTLGGFILVDRFSHDTVAAGLIRHSLRRAQNVHRQATAVTRADRERLNGHPGLVVWFTGLSGSGKSTVANALERRLFAEGRHTYLLDGDNLRLGINKDLGFTDADRVENIRRAAEVAKVLVDAGLIVLTALISPFRAERQMAREIIGAERFLEVYVATPLEVCERRDPKGLYRKARAGQIPNFTGINSPYEPPLAPDLVVDTSQMGAEEAAAAVEKALGERLGFLNPEAPGS